MPLECGMIFFLLLQIIFKANFKPTVSEVRMNADNCISASSFSSIATYSRFLSFPSVSY